MTWSKSSRRSVPTDPLQPLDFIARLAELVPRPRANLARFHGVFAPNSRYRGRVTKARWGRGGQSATSAELEAPTPAERRAAMTWAQRLKWVFGIDIETCRKCGGTVRIIASIEDPKVIEKVLTHLDAQAGEPETPRRPPREDPLECAISTGWEGAATAKGHYSTYALD